MGTIITVIAVDRKKATNVANLTNQPSNQSIKNKDNA